MPNYDFICHKLELAFRAYLQPILAADPEVPISSIQVTHEGEVLVPPFIVSTSELRGERVAGRGVYDVELSYEVRTQADAADPALNRLMAGRLIAQLNDKNAVRLALNRPPSPGVDSRTVRDFHLYDYGLQGGRPDVEKRRHITLMTLLCVCQGMDI